MMSDAFACACYEYSIVVLPKLRFGYSMLATVLQFSMLMGMLQIFNAADRASAVQC